jgi:hypothetical protein
VTDGTAHSTTAARPTGADRTRQVVVAVSVLLAVAGGFAGSGALGGTPVDTAAGGALSADATLIAPGGTAFSIWSVIYAGLIAYAVWQLVPRQAAAERHRRLGYWVAGSGLLNAAWLLCVQAEVLWLTLVVIVALLTVLLRSFLLTLALRPTNVVDALVTDGTIGLYLGWVMVATAANAASVVVDTGFDGWGVRPDVWAVIGIGLIGVAGVLLAVRGAGRIAPMLSLAWGLAWIAAARFDDPVSVPTALAAIIAAAVVVVVTGVARLRTGIRSRVTAG